MGTWWREFQKHKWAKFCSYLNKKAFNDIYEYIVLRNFADLFEGHVSRGILYVSCQPPMLSGFYKNVNGFLWVDNYFPSGAWDNSFI